MNVIKKTDKDILLIRNSLSLTYTQALDLAMKNQDKTTEQIISDARMKQRNSSIINHIIKPKQ